MTIEQLKKYAEFMKEYNLSVLDFQEDENKKVHLEMGTSAPLAHVAPPVEHTHKEENKSVSGTAVKSPMVGVFYAAMSPDAKPFVSEGAKVKKGDVLCIIEAMKLMNEITADKDGEIVKVCVEDGQVVEFGQCLFLIN